MAGFKGVAVDGERRRGTGIPVTVNDRWHVGSIAKSMTATLIAVLEHEGKLSIDNAMPELLPDIEMAVGWRPCTLQHLLTHTAGAPANFPMKVLKVWPDTAEELVAARRRFIAEILAEAPESPCGERYSYSNVGYTIVGHIAGTIAGVPYESLMKQKVFIPLELNSAGFGPPKGDMPNEEPLGHLKLLWFRFALDPFESPADNTPVMAPAGGLHLSIRDLARYGSIHPRGRKRDCNILATAGELGTFAYAISRELRVGLGSLQQGMGGRAGALAQWQQHALVRLADAAARQEHRSSVCDQRWRDRRSGESICRIGSAVERGDTGILIKPKALTLLRQT